jgi:dipeptidyl aminopeptidase/acylaminoacyl peptidase
MTSRQAFSIDDLFLDQRITDVHLAAGGQQVVCAVRRPSRADDRYRSSLWRFSLDGAPPRRITHTDSRDDAPRWAPDGSQIAFLSDRAETGTSQIHLIPADGGESRALTGLPRGVGSFAWRPQGDLLLAVCPVSVDPDRRVDGDEITDGEQARARDAQLPQLVWRTPYKADGTGYELDTRHHLFLVDADSGQATQLTHGPFNVRSAAWAPDGERICLSRTREDEGFEHCTDIWMLSLDGRRAGARQRLSHRQSNSSSPAWSPDGHWIVFSGSVEDGDAQQSLWLIDAQTVGKGDGNERRTAVQPLGDESIEVVAGELHWHRDSSAVAFVQAHLGLQRIASIAVPGGALAAVVGGHRHVDRLACNERDLVFTVQRADAPCELHRADWRGEGEAPLSRLNDWWDHRTVPQVELRRFNVPDGRGRHEEIDGWLLRPAGVRDDAPTPLLVDVHGGPASYAMLDFAKHAYWQVMASRGWSVLALNTVGSSSYGRDFAARLRTRWGELDLPQVLAAIDDLQAKGVVDERLAIIGGSYGGYLGAWAIGHCRRFRAAIVCAPVANLESHFGTSDSGYYADAYSIGGEPKERRALMARLSPMTSIEQANTPTLFLQGKDDQRCPVGQSEELFTKLRRCRRAPCEMVLYPGGDHHVLTTGRPSHRRDGLQRIVDWLERWVGADSQARAA